MSVPKPAATTGYAVPRESEAPRRDKSSLSKLLKTLSGLRRRHGDRGVAVSASSSVDPEAIAAKYNLAIACLRKGDYENGFELYESRFAAFGERMKHARRFAHSLGEERRWNGQPIAGVRLLVWTEQGYGDSIMMLRYLPLLKLEGARELLVVCEPEMARLIGTIPAVDRVVTTGNDLSPDEFDLHCPAMSLPREFRTRRESVPNDVPYLQIPKRLVDIWRDRFSEIKRAKVGFAWAGAATLEADARRSIPLATFASVFSVPHVQFISLQKDRRLDELMAQFPLSDWMPECRDFLDTAALIEALDLVISVDTAVAHLAGAVGKQVWLLNRSEGEWRWGDGLTRSVWYPTMAIFNQRSPGRWDDVIEDVSRELEHAAGSATGAGAVHEATLKDFDGLLSSGSRSLQQGDNAGAEAKFRDAIRVRSDSASAWNGLGVALALQDRHADAWVALERAGQLENTGGDACDSFVNLANSFASDGRLQDALAVYRQNLPTRPNPQGHHNYALTLLTAGELIEGWRHYEFRWLVEPLRSLRPNYPQPEWAGQDLRGKTILLYCEQGFGDTIQFVRYAPQLKALGAQVVLLAQPELVHLGRGFSGVDAIVDSTRELAFDYYIPLLSLPRVFGTDLSSIPVGIPYVMPDPERQNRWQEWLSGESGPRVGVVWAGSRTHSRDRSRSLPLSVLQPLLDTSGIRFYSFQKSVDADPAERAASNNYLIDLGPRLEDFADTAAALSSMDLMVCVDTSVAHLAAALGKPVWLMLPRPADFRWLEGREDSPWYPTMRLFRQTARDDWDDVVERVKAALREWARQTRSGTARRAEPSTMPVACVPLPSAEATIVKAGHRPGLTAVANTRAGILQYVPDEPVVGDSIAWYGEYLQQQLDLLGSVVRRGATVMEVGAGVGAHALGLCRMLGETARVFLLESRPVLRRILQQNLAVNGVTNATVLPRKLENAPECRLGVAATETIDGLALERLDCLKVGAGTDPLEALNGANDTLWRLRPLLFLAVDDEPTAKRLADRVREFGYRCWRMESPLFDARNFNRRESDIFTQGTVLALLAIPEESEVDVNLDNCNEI